MQLPVQITYRHMEPSESIDNKIRDKAAKLERFYQRIISCRVVVEAPSKPHRLGNQFHVRIDIAVPGGEIAVNRDSADQIEFKEMPITLRDAFEAARRQLEDYADKQRGEVKTHTT